MDFTGERWIPGQVDPRIEEDHLQRYLFALAFTPGRRVLDIACGAGGGTHLLVTRGGAASAEGVDISAEAIQHAQAHYTEPNLRYRVGDVETYAAEQPFDVITCFETIEHVADDRLVLRNLRSWIAPDGVLLISSPNRPITSPQADSIDDRPTNKFHVREFTPAELRGRMAAAGFTRFRTYGQRPRLHSRFGRVAGWLDRLRQRAGRNPDLDATAAVRPFRFLTPRYFVIEARP